MIIHQSTLLKALLTVNKAVSTSLIIPALENYQFTIADNKLTIAANNLKFYIKTTISVVTDDLCIQIKASTLLEFVKNLPEQPLTFEFSEKTVLITYQNKGKLQLPIEDGKDFPTPEFPKTKQTLVVNSDVFNEGLYKTVWAKETSRPDKPSLECINLLLSPGQFVFNGGSFRSISTHTIAVEHKVKADLLIPDYSLAALEFPAETDLSIIIDTGKLAAMYGDTAIVVTLADDNYPDISGFLAMATDRTAVIDRDLLLSTVNRIKGFAGGVNKALILNFDQELTITAQNIDYSHHAEETTSIEYTGEPIKMAVNADVFINALKRLTACHICIAGEKSPLVLRESEGSENRFFVSPVTYSN